MRVLVTRPQPDAQATADMLRRLGHEPIAAPVSQVVFETQAAIPVLQGPGRPSALAVTSANAVRSLVGRSDIEALVRLPLYAVGDATAAVAREAGFAAVQSSAGTVEDLALTLARTVDPASGAILYLAGRDRAGDLAALMAASGHKVIVVEVYRVVEAPHWPKTVVDQLEGGEIQAALVFSRASGIVLLRRLAELRGVHISEQLSIHALSEPAAEPFRRSNYTRIFVARRPNADDLCATLACMERN